MYRVIDDILKFVILIPGSVVITKVLQKILDLVFGPATADKLKENGSVLCYDVVLNTKVHQIQLTNTQLFLKKFKSVGDISVIDNDDVTLYSVDSRNFIFVRSKFGVDLYDVDKHPFFGVNQHDSAVEVITATHEAVFRYMSGKPTRDGKNITVMYMISRCGSTLVTAMVHKTGQAVAISEPFVFDLMIKMFNKTDLALSRDSKHEIGLVRMCLLLLTKDPERLYFIKLSGIQNGILAHLIQYALPGTKEIFLYRALKPVVVSIRKIFGTLFSFLAINKGIKGLSIKYKSLWKKIKVNGINKQWIYYLLCQMHPFHLEARQRRDIKSYSYESLSKDAEGFCSSILKDIGVNNKYVGQALSALDKDSQIKFAFLSRKTLERRSVHILAEDLDWAKKTAREEFGIELEGEDGLIENFPNCWQSF